MSTAAYRSTKVFKEVVQVIEKAKAYQDLVLWQTREGQRYQTKIKVEELQPDTLRLKISFVETAQHLDAEEMCTVRIPSNDCVFRSKFLQFGANSAWIAFPQELILEEKRNEERTAFQMDDQKFATINGMKFPVMNVSPRGIAFQIPVSNVRTFQAGHQVKLEALGEVQLETPILADILHMRQDKSAAASAEGQEAKFIIGCKLGAPIPSAIFGVFAYIERPKVFNDPKFFTDPAFLKSVQEAIPRVHEKMAQRPELKEALEKLTVKLQANKYLKDHIENLARITCQVGKEVGWVTLQNVDKIIYISYLHDIRYFDFPYLSKVDTRAEIELNPIKYSQDDLKVFLTGPFTAAELATKDDALYRDARRILLQLKERPDGSGFPSGIKVADFQQLTCLFLICHDFTKYVLEEGGWNYPEFFRRCKLNYSYPQFGRILGFFDKLPPNHAQK